ncbi:type II toxin-antitoxin system RelE/ParE family toxin [Mucilaginibacter segetis]|uniref:Type II toxin-antitoxin system RelE/ParE family toxin n=1 Tax=Mucilaginibacter segetis TaxID=2793071 RepID=A0A934PU33_9SPHI|nr:type II toxin-antitoxin system RelE/ParE family toxin [Mucilaginibacter segetis]MBK0379587.1 type II toxin-antitoxin system RelE/ParE family toxin [Mucilaginibacter segetis]
MSRSIFWTEEAQETFDHIVLLIDDKWGMKQAGIFINRVQTTLKLIAVQPYMYQASLIAEIRRAVISKQTSLFYKVNEKSIIVLYFWDNRQDPLIS